MLTRHALFYATLTCALALISTAYAAPLNEPTASATTTAEGLAATLEISKLGADLSNSISNDGFASADGATLQPYASTEVDTVAELAPTSLPMTKEEMALAEVAAVVAELATTTAAELKVKEDGKYAEDELEAMQQIWRNAEEAKRQVIARELANAVDTLEGGRLNDEKDFVAATTTLRTSFVETVAAATTTMSPATTTESPQILNELVRAAAAANEILAAALNAANLAATSTNMTDATAVVVNENTIATTMKPALASNTEAGSVDGLVDVTASVSDNEELSEAADAVTWRPNVGKTEATNVDGEVNGEKTIATATTTATTVERINADTASDLNVSFGADGVAEFEKSPEIQTSTQLDVQETTTTVSIMKSADEVVNEPTNVEPILWRTGEFLLEHNHSALNKEEMPTALKEVTSEAAESIEHSKTKELERAESAIALERLETTTISDDISAQSTELSKDYEASTPQPNTVADGEVVGEQANIVETANQVAPQATDNDKEFSETQIAEVVEVKQAQMAQDDSQVNETTTSSLNENSNLIPTTTEPLETLIAVESEAQEPNKIISTAWNEPQKEATTTTPEVVTTAENFVAPLQPTYAELNHQEAIATTTTGPSDEKEAATESEYVINTEISLTTTTPAAAQSENTFTTSTSGDQAEYTTISQAPNQQTTTPSSAQTELPNMREVAAMEAVPMTTAHSVAEEALEISLDTQQLPTTTLSAGEQHADTTQFSVGAEETTTPAEATTIPSEISQPTAAVLDEIRTSSAERIHETTYSTESKDSSTDVSLAPFTTTPAALEVLTEPEVITRQSELDAYAVVVGSTEIPQPAAVPAPDITNSADTFAATLSSGRATETTTTLAAIESAVPDFTTPPAAAEGELHTETVEPAVEVKTLEALAEPIADPAATKSVLVEEQPLYIRTTTEPQQRQQQQQAFSDSESESVSITTPTTARITAEVESETVATTSIPNQVDITTTTTTSTTTTAAEPEIITTTTTSESETTTTTTTTTTSTTTTAAEPEIITTTTTFEPEATTTTTTSAPEPDVITTTTSFEPESTTTTTATTTTTTTLSPMSLIVAEHEARSLDRSPPRVSRIVSEDGVEVLTGYSIVHHIYAAALAAFEAGGA